MGSLGPVKLLKDKKPCEVTKNLLQDISNLSSKSAKMGNLCSVGTGAAAKKVRTPAPPHSLEELLYDMQVKDDVNSKTVDTVIESSHWATQFRQYLSTRKLEDDITILRFLVLVHPLKTCTNLNNNQAQILGHSKIQKKMSGENQRRFFMDIFETFLSEESENQVPLSNQALWGELMATYTSLKENKPVSPQSISEILRVRRDPSLWDQGIEPAYNRFLKQAPPPTLAACILSIL